MEESVANKDAPKSNECLVRFDSSSLEKTEAEASWTLKYPRGGFPIRLAVQLSDALSGRRPRKHSRKSNYIMNLTSLTTFRPLINILKIISFKILNMVFTKAFS